MCIAACTLHHQPHQSHPSPTTVVTLTDQMASKTADKNCGTAFEAIKSDVSRTPAHPPSPANTTFTSMGTHQFAASHLQWVDKAHKVPAIEQKEALKDTHVVLRRLYEDESGRLECAGLAKYDVSGQALSIDFVATLDLKRRLGLVHCAQSDLGGEVSGMTEANSMEALTADVALKAADMEAAKVRGTTSEPNVLHGRSALLVALPSSHH